MSAWPRVAALVLLGLLLTTSAAWALGGGLAGVAGVLVGTYGNIDAFTLGLQVLPAFVAALIGGLESLPGALIGCAVVALVQAEIPALQTLPVIGPAVSGVGSSQLMLMSGKFGPGSSSVIVYVNVVELTSVIVNAPLSSEYVDP